MNAILLRVGIDSGKHAGEWNAPCNPESGDFVYVPVPAGDRHEESPMKTYYADIISPALERFSVDNYFNISLPCWLEDDPAHLDPDFRVGRLSYGNSLYNESGPPDGRAIALKTLGDAVGERFVIFYNSMEPINKPRPLEYGIIGILKVQTVKQVKDITDAVEISRNIHARRCAPVGTDVVVFGEPSDKSGRLERYLPIGEQRSNGSYYLQESLKREWGGICNITGSTDIRGGIQRSFYPIWLCNPRKFFEWWEKQNPTLMQKNNL